MIETILDTLRFGMEIMPDSSAHKREVLECANVLRALYFEVCTNLAVLNQLKSEKIENQFELVRTVAPLLQNSVGALVVYGAEGRLLKNLDKIQEMDDAIARDTETLPAGDGEETAVKAKTLRQAIEFCVQKIEVLKRFAEVTPAQEIFFKDIKASVRLDNIKYYANQIRRVIETHAPFMAEEAYS